MDDTLVLWDHGEEILTDFLNHLNSIDPAIKFTMEIEKDKQLPFLDVLLERDDQGISTTVYRKKTHTDQYLHWESNHSNSTKRGIIRCLATRAKTVCKTENTLNKEHQHLKQAFRQNGYPETVIDAELNKISKDQTVEPPVSATAVVPYVKGITEKLKRVGKKYNVQVIGKCQNTIKKKITKLSPEQDLLLQKGAIYSIPMEPCKRTYIGESGRTVQKRISEHKSAVSHNQIERNNVARHSHDCKCLPQFGEVKILGREENRFKRTIREALEIEKAGQNTFAQKSYNLPSLWNKSYLNKLT